MKKTFAKDPVIDRSLRASIKDGVFFSTMVGTSESYFGAYAVLLKASAPQVGLLASLPPLLAAFGQIVPCGIADADVTSLEIELGRSITIEEVVPLIERHILDSLKKVSA